MIEVNKLVFYTFLIQKIPFSNFCLLYTFFFKSSTIESYRQLYLSFGFTQSYLSTNCIV
jgi:hypothetical protein